MFCRKKQFRYLLESKGKKPGIICEETSDNKRFLGENTNRATLNYTTREFYHEKLEVRGSVGLLLPAVHMHGARGHALRPPYTQPQKHQQGTGGHQA